MILRALSVAVVLALGSGAYAGSANAGNSRAPRREHLLRHDRTGQSVQQGLRLSGLECVAIPRPLGTVVVTMPALVIDFIRRRGLRLSGRYHTQTRAGSSYRSIGRVISANSANRTTSDVRSYGRYRGKPRTV